MTQKHSVRQQQNTHTYNLTKRGTELCVFVLFIWTQVYFELRNLLECNTYTPYHMILNGGGRRNEEEMMSENVENPFVSVRVIRGENTIRRNTLFSYWH